MIGKKRTLKTMALLTGIVFAGICGLSSAQAAGILTPTVSGHKAIQIRDHQVDVTINNGFAVTEVVQTFFNPNSQDLEAIYSFPLPKSASLSEVTCHMGETELHGEVLARDEARRLYDEEKSSGGETGLAEKNEFYTFDFFVYPVRAMDETRIRFLYYQPLEIDTGVGRYVYPLEAGGTDKAAHDFWKENSTVENFFSATVELKSAWPVSAVRVPGHEGAATVHKHSDGHYVVKVEKQTAALDEDFVFYYRLAEGLPGRVEFIPYKPKKDKPGTFMMVVTPGIDLKTLDNGADYLFVLDISGSMAGKIGALGEGVIKALGEMKQGDRFRIVTFNTCATDLTGNWIDATPANVKRTIKVVKRLRTSGGTDLYQGLEMALRSLDDERATSLVLVTDAVTNTGVVSPAAFHDLMKEYDVRLFGFVMGNSGNWPLMRVICDASGGFSAGVSNDDDIIGQIVLAKSKIVHECLHDAKLKISGVEIFAETEEHFGKIYRGEQLVFFGRYDRGGRATVELEARLTGEDRTYKTVFDFPEVDTLNPEIERLWALHRIEQLEEAAHIGRLERDESRAAIEDLGVKYQLVTDETSMVVLSDEVFERKGIERRNQQRTRIEKEARAERARAARESGRPVRSRRADESNPMFDRPSPSPSRGGGGGGAGALDPATVGLILGSILLAGCAVRPRKRARKGNDDE